MNEQKPFAFLQAHHTNVFQEKVIQALDFLNIDIQRVTPLSGSYEELSILLPGTIESLNALVQLRNLPDLATALSSIAKVELYEQGNKIVEMRLQPKGMYHTSAPKF